MILTAEEEAMRAGRMGPAVRWAIEQQIQVGHVLGARRLVPVNRAHMMGDMEVLGESGFAFLQSLQRQDARVRVTTTTNARCVDFAFAERLRQDPGLVAREAELRTTLGRMGVILSDTCINYQTLDQPHFGQHIAWGDTGTVIYANSVYGARTNFESGPAALAAGLTGRTPMYGFHRPQARRGRVVVDVTARLVDLTDWGALGAVVGRRLNDYWQVPVFTGIEEPAVSGDELKHLGASLASYGSLAMFHMVGVTPEAPDVETACQGEPPAAPAIRVDDAAIAAVYDSYSDAGAPPGEAAGRPGEAPDLVVFTAPQLSVFEMAHIAALLDGRRVRAGTTFVVTTNAQNRQAAADLGYLDTLSEAGVLVLTGVCFYLMALPDMRRRFGWRSLLTNSAKVANIVGGYGLRSVLRRTAECVEAATEPRPAGGAAHNGEVWNDE